MPSRLALCLPLLALILLVGGCSTPQQDQGNSAVVSAADLRPISATAELAPVEHVVVQQPPRPAEVPVTEIDTQPQVDQLKKQLAPGGPDTSKQDLIFDATKFDFGKIKSTAGILTATFTAMNRGKNLIQIVRSEKDCGCLLVKPLPSQVEPLGRLPVIIQINPSGKNGRLSHLFTIQTDEAVPYYFLNVLANVEYVRGQDQPSIYIPSLVKGTTEHVEVIIESASDILPRATFELPDPNLLITKHEVDGATLDLWITTAPGAVRAKLHPRLIIRNPDTNQEAVLIPMVVVIDDNVHFNTPSLFFGRLTPGVHATREVRLESFYGDVPKVARARLEGAAADMGVAEVVVSSTGTFIRVTVYPETVPPPIYRATLRVELESADQPEALLDVLAVIATEAKTLDFSATPTPTQTPTPTSTQTPTGTPTPTSFTMPTPGPP